MRDLASKAGDAHGLPPTPQGPDLRLVSSDDGHILLDIQHDQVLKLNAVAAEMWKSLSAGQPESEIVARIAQQFKVDETRVAVDLRKLREQLEQFGVSPTCCISVERTPTRASGAKQTTYPWYGQAIVRKPEPKLFTIIAAFVGLILFELILHCTSLKYLCSCVNACPVRKRAVADNTAARVCSAVERAAVWYPVPAVCFERSAVTACLLKLHGLTARMMIGIRPFPLLLHSWVEVSDDVVNDWRPVSGFYHTATSY